MPEQFYGVDFSGARDAGEKIWLARARRDGDSLIIDALLPARELPGSGRDVESALNALVRLVAESPRAAFGLDFPFALAGSVVEHEPWASWVAGFARRYPDAGGFRAACRAASGGQEIKRLTDQEARVPFNGFNLRVYRQTWAGLARLIAPLLEAEAAVVLPMQTPRPDRASLFEICPASTLKRLGLYYGPDKRPLPYKGREARHREARAQLLAAIESAYGLGFAAPELRERAIANAGGDALDAVIAVAATAAAAKAPLALPPACAERAEVEGYIYV